MFERIIRFAVEQRWLVLLAVIGMAAFGIYSYQNLPIDAVPDITNVQVQINTAAPGYSPLEAEQRITFPVETAMAVADGATEIDTVINISALKSGADLLVMDDLQAVVDAAGMGGAIVKVILECGLLTDKEKQRAAKLCVDAGAAFVKTSTGFAASGATVEDVRLLRAAVGPDIGVKAAGSIRTVQDALALIEAGANRIGTSAGCKLLDAFSE